MMVTDEQLIYIQKHIAMEGVTHVPLMEDLVDHFCTSVEAQMEEGIDFEQAFEEAREKIAPQGAKEIEDDLNFLLTIKNKIMVRKIVFLAGFFALFNVMLGVALRMPGIIDAELSRLMIMSGMLLLMVSVVPYIFYHFYKKSVDKLQES